MSAFIGEGARLIGVVAASLCFSTAASGQISEEALQRQISGYANDLCGICHHDPGSKKELAPRIAGQQRAYIEAQLNAFRQKSRGEPEAYDCMWGLSSALSDGMVAALAGYFASQAPFAGIPGDGDLIDKGRAVFNRSEKPEGTLSCAQCHLSNVIQMLQATPEGFGARFAIGLTPQKTADCTQRIIVVWVIVNRAPPSFRPNRDRKACSANTSVRTG